MERSAAEMSKLNEGFYLTPTYQDATGMECRHRRIDEIPQNFRSQECEVKPFNSFCMETTKNEELPDNDLEKALQQQTKQELSSLNAEGQCSARNLDYQDTSQEQELFFEHSSLWNDSCGESGIDIFEKNNQGRNQYFSNDNFVKTEGQKDNIYRGYPENASASCSQVRTLPEQNNFLPCNELVESQIRAYPACNENYSTGYTNQLSTAPPQFYQSVTSENFQEKYPAGSQTNINRNPSCAEVMNFPPPPHQSALYCASRNPPQNFNEVQKFSGYNLYPNEAHNYPPGVTGNGCYFRNSQDNSAIKFHIRTITHCEVECPAPGKLPISKQPWQELANGANEESSYQNKNNENLGITANHVTPVSDPLVNSFRPGSDLPHVLVQEKRQTSILIGYPMTNNNAFNNIQVDPTKVAQAPPQANNFNGFGTFDARTTSRSPKRLIHSSSCDQENAHTGEQVNYIYGTGQNEQSNHFRPPLPVTQWQNQSCESGKKSKPTRKKVLCPSKAGAKKFKCTNEGCCKKFSKEKELKVHINKYHLQLPKPYFCSYCSKSFKRPDQLKRHEKIHTGEKPHQCSICGRQFARTDHRNTHFKKHSNDFDKSNTKSLNKSLKKQEVKIMKSSKVLPEQRDASNKMNQKDEVIFPNRISGSSTWHPPPYFIHTAPFQSGQVQFQSSSGLQ